MTQGIEQVRPEYRSWLRGSLILLAVLVVGRFVLEVAGVRHNGTQYLSSTAAIFFVAIYLGAIAPLRGVTKFVQLIVPSIVVSAWTVVWVMFVTVITAVLRLERSHFAEPEDFGNWGHLGGHLFGHVVEFVVFSVLVFVLMGITLLLYRWPVTVGPGALLGALVILRYWVEAMGAPAGVATAFSSTVGVFVCGFYLGGIGPRQGIATAKQLLVPSLVLGWTWRLWVFLATLLSASVPFYKTHFFDPSQGRVAVRLAQFFLASVVEGLVAGLVVWGIAFWISRAMKQVQTA